jgi:hypothetical protein
MQGSDALFAASGRNLGLQNDGHDLHQTPDTLNIR